jgi:hypothetical protein
VRAQASLRAADGIGPEQAVRIKALDHRARGRVRGAICAGRMNQPWGSTLRSRRTLCQVTYLADVLTAPKHGRIWQRSAVQSLASARP